MADYDSSLPVRTEDKGDVVVKLVDTSGLNELVVTSSGEAQVAITTDSVGLARDHTTETDYASVRITDGTVFIDPRDRSWTIDYTTDSVTAKQETGDVWDVRVVEGISSGERVNDYQEHADVAVGGTSTHTYTVPTGKTLKLKQVWLGASGKAKITVAVGPSGSESVVYVGFNSSANPNINLDIDEVVEVAEGENVLVTVTNRDHHAQSIYTTINGTLV